MRDVLNRASVRFQIKQELAKSAAPTCIRRLSTDLLDECDRAAAAAIAAVVRVAVAQHRRGSATLKPPAVPRPRRDD